MFRPPSRRRFLTATSGFAVAALAGVRPSWASEEDPLPATARLNGWLETRWQFWLNRSPMQQGYLGLKTNFDKWDDIGEARAHDDLVRKERELADLRNNFNPAGLTPDGRLSFRLYEYQNQHDITDYRWRHHQYPVSQMDGWQQEIPAFLINIHHIDNIEEAQAYIARLSGIGSFIEQVMEQMRLGEAAGVLAPRFAYGHALRDCQNVVRGAPFDTTAAKSPLWADFTDKVDRLAIDPTVKQRLRGDAIKVLVGVVQPAFLKLIKLCQEQESRATTDDGAWKHPDGDAYYAACLARHTTTDMTAENIHAFGLAEVERIHSEMRGIMRVVGFNGDLKAFFAFLKNNPQFYYPQTPEGKAAYMARAEEIIGAMRARLDEVFMRRPRAKLAVKAVEPFREQSATSAFYQPPGAYDGRPGTYYVNTFDMKAVSKFEMEALAYHEGIPGHHMQIALTQEMSDLPQFRRFAGYTAFAEGWGVYCERLAKEMGFYEDPYSDFGRLSSELWRACRLVVDTGIHDGDTRWTRQQAIDYLTENTPNSTTDITNSVERYIVDPGQATAYKIGMARILELREDAKAKLGDKFDLRAYHNVVLSSGSVPLTFLADNVAAWVKQTLEEG